MSDRKDIWENADKPKDPKQEPSAYFYPPSAFHFRVSFGQESDWDTSFQEVSGIGPEIETEPVVEGGENRYVYQLPKSVKHPRLVLKRGIARVKSPLVNWCKKVLEEFEIPIMPMDIHVRLLNEEGDPLRAWSFGNAYPVKWEIESFNSTKNEVAIEKMEFSYTHSTREETLTEEKK